MSKKKIRVEMRKNRNKPPRENDFTRDFQLGERRAEDTHADERVRAKGDQSRRRTIVQDDSANPAEAEELLRGRVLRAHGLQSVVESADGRVFRCAIRRLLKTMSTDERNVLATGDWVWFRISGQRDTGSAIEHGTDETDEMDETDETDMQGATVQDASSSFATRHSPLATSEGLIERVEPRHGVLTRASRRREQVLVANVDQAAIVVSLVEPLLKPHLIDRYLAAAEKGGLKPILCLNKADRADLVELQPLVGAYSQMGVPTLVTSARTGLGVERLRQALVNRATVFSGQSGVGKSSLLNAVQPGLELSVRSVSEMNSKGRHTTTYAQLIRLEAGGWVVDTPGLRQLQLWDVRPEEVEGFFRDFRPFVPHCAFPDCTHTHEAGCAIKDAVARNLLSSRRYYSYLGLFQGSSEE